MGNRLNVFAIALTDKAKKKRYPEGYLSLLLPVLAD
jgi:hypothetical protein